MGSDRDLDRSMVVPRPEQGRIVRVETSDPQGRNTKKRPVVIVHPTDEIKSGELIVCVAITGEIPKKIPDDCVLLPYQAGGHSRTGLRKRCAALCTWLVEITEDQIIEYMGVASKAHVDAILARLSKLE